MLLTPETLIIKWTCPSRNTAEMFLLLLQLIVAKKTSLGSILLSYTDSEVLCYLMTIP